MQSASLNFELVSINKHHHCHLITDSLVRLMKKTKYNYKWRVVKYLFHLCLIMVSPSSSRFGYCYFLVEWVVCIIGMKRPPSVGLSHAPPVSGPSCPT